MKTRLLIIIAIGIIGFIGFAFAEHNPNQPYIHSMILPNDIKEKTFDEFMEWCVPFYGVKCVELEKNRIPIILSPPKQIQSEIVEDISYNRICPVNTDWPDAPNQCDMRENYTRTELKNLYDEYYQYKGTEWMEMKKAEMDSVISDGSWIGGYYELSVWLGHTQRELRFENINVYLYYSLNGQAPNLGGGLYSANDEFEPVITLYYVSPGAIMIISSIIVTGAMTGVILSFKETGLHPKRKIFAIIGFALIFVGVTMYSVGLFELIQSQINQIGEEFVPPKILYNMLVLFGIPIALAGIPVILHGVMQRFSIMMTVLMSLGVVISWIMFILSRFD